MLMKPLGSAIKITDEAQWHTLRAQHVGGSEVAGALGVGRWSSRYALWAEKTGKIERPSFGGDERILFGKLLEPAIAKAVGEKRGWKVRKSKRYLSGRPDSPMGGTLDFVVVGDSRGLGVLEIKTTDRMEHKKWEEAGGVPIDYLLQTTTYMALAGAAWGVIAVLVGGNHLVFYEVERRESTIEMIRDGVREFWRHVEDNEAPAPDFERDSAVVAKLYAAVTEGKTVDLSGNNRATELTHTYINAAAAETEACKLKEGARAELLTLVGDAKLALVDGYKINSIAVSASPSRVITADQVGEIIKGRSGYRRITVGER